MVKVFLLAALAAMLLLTGCARSSVAGGQSAPRPSAYGAVTTAGFKPVSHVEPCCADMAAGRIPVAECFNRPACKAKGNTCCMNAMQDFRPARI